MQCTRSAAPAPPVPADDASSDPPLMASLVYDSFDLVDLPLLVVHLRDGLFDRVHANPAFFAFTGCTRVDLNARGMQSVPVADPDSHSRLSHLCDAILQGVARSEELNLLTPRDLRRRVLASVKPLPGSSSSSARALLVLTEPKRAQQELGTFLSEAVHELQTPLTSVKGYAALLAQHRLDSARQASIASLIERQTDRLSRLVNELMTLSQMDSRGTRSMTFAAIDLLSLLSDTMDALGPERSERIQVALPSDPLPTPRGDHDKLVQLLVNVLDNALKYSFKDSTVFLDFETVADHPSGDALSIRVRDHGAGLEPSDLKKIFRRFYRSPQHGQIPGTGLGLPLVKLIIELHGGTIAFHSTPGKGSQVEIQLPLTAQTY
jgi:signal transduction histidine kinase